MRLVGFVSDLLVVLSKEEREFSLDKCFEKPARLTEALNLRSCRTSVIPIGAVSLGRLSEPARKLSLVNDMESADKILQEMEGTIAAAPETTDVERIPTSKDKEITDEVSSRLVNKSRYVLRLATSVRSPPLL